MYVHGSQYLTNAELVETVWW